MIDRIDDCAFKMNQVFSIRVAYKFCYGNACDDIKRDKSCETTLLGRKAYSDLYKNKIFRGSNIFK